MKIPSARILLPALAAVASALVLAACGSEKQPTQHGHSEGFYVEAGDLIYQVQMSRELNPENVEDREYLAGLPAGTADPADDEEWFGVWLRVQNDTEEPQEAAEEFKIVDTTGREYEPVELEEGNVFAYRPATVEGKDGQPLLPDPESAAGAGPIQGALILFKLNVDVYDNRPLEFEIVPPDGGEASTIELDL